MIKRCFLKSSDTENLKFYYQEIKIKKMFSDVYDAENLNFNIGKLDDQYVSNYGMFIDEE